MTIRSAGKDGYPGLQELHIRPIIPATEVAEVGRLRVQGQPGQFCKTLFQINKQINKSTH
jgi:hypothetical protein